MEINDPRFHQGITLFNQQEFFACHDVFEELWSETLSAEREFLQGLIHVAVALFHFGEGNLSGARKMHDSAMRYLLPYADDYAGIQLGRLMNEFHHCFQSLTQIDSGYPAGVQINPQAIPTITYLDQ